MQHNLIGILQIIAGAICWGTLGILGTQLNRLGFTGTEVATLRILIAGLTLLVILPYFRPYLRQIKKRHMPTLVVQSLIGMLGMSLCYFAAVARVGSSLAVTLLYTAPVWSLAFARLLLSERISRKSAFLSATAVLGVSLTMLGNGTADPTGILVGLGSGMCYALYGVLGKRAMSGNPPMLVLFTSIILSAFALLLFPNTYPTIAKLTQQSPAAWAATAGLSFIGTIGASFLFMRGLQKMPATKASVFTIFEPLTAVLLAAVLLGERLQTLQYIGVVLILAAVLLNTAPPHTPRRRNRIIIS